MYVLSQHLNKYECFVKLSHKDWFNICQIWKFIFSLFGGLSSNFTKIKLMSEMSSDLDLYIFNFLDIWVWYCYRTNLKFPEVYIGRSPFFCLKGAILKLVDTINCSLLTPITKLRIILETINVVPEEAHLLRTLSCRKSTLAEINSVLFGLVWPGCNSIFTFKMQKNILSLISDCYVLWLSLIVQNARPPQNLADLLHQWHRSRIDHIECIITAPWIRRVGVGIQGRGNGFQPPLGETRWPCCRLIQYRCC